MTTSTATGSDAPARAPLRLLMVVPRFGPKIVGGAETLVRGLALRAVAPGDVVEVATTCAESHVTWENTLPAGELVDEGVLVRRFCVSPRDDRAHARLHSGLMRGQRLSYLEQQELMATSVWSEELDRFLDEEADGYDLVLCAPYLFGIGFWGAQVRPERTALITCLHDEPYAYLDAVARVVASVRGCVFNSPGEERLARRLFRVRDGGVVGGGLDPVRGPAPAGFADRHGLGPYLLYAGRIEQGKRVHVAAEYMSRYRRERGSDLRLVLIGQGDWRPPPRHADAARVIGFVDEESKRAAYAEAVALVNPSELESLSLVLLEAWREGTPALVAAGSEVMVDHVKRSGGGVTFDDYTEFARGLDRILAEGERARLGDAGRRYVAEEYGWPSVRARFESLVTRLAAPRRSRAADVAGTVGAAVGCPGVRGAGEGAR